MKLLEPRTGDMIAMCDAIDRVEPLPAYNPKFRAWQTMVEYVVHVVSRGLYPFQQDYVRELRAFPRGGQFRAPGKSQMIDMSGPEYIIPRKSPTMFIDEARTWDLSHKRKPRK